jgi:diguanylate cyclase (GGDEF)-like protein
MKITKAPLEDEYPSNLQNRIIFCISAILLYALLFIPLYGLFSIRIILLSIIPLGLISYQFGWRVGTIAACLFIPFNILLLLTAGEKTLDFFGDFFWLTNIFLITSSLFLGYIRDLQYGLRTQIKESKKLKNKLKHFNSLDSLTSLPNLSFFHSSVNQSIARCERNQRILSVLFVDIKNFKAVNEEFGHQQGDSILSAFSIRLQNCLRGYDLVARVGGDEFLILLDDLPHQKISDTICDRLITTMSKPYLVSNHKIVLSINIGISVYPYDAKDTDQLIKFAEAAMYDAKSDENITYKFYSADS